MSEEEPLEEITAGVQVSEEEIAKEVGKIVERLEKQRKAEPEEEPEVYGIVVYKPNPLLIEALIVQTDLYEQVLSGELTVSEARARAKKELQEVTDFLEKSLIVDKGKKEEKKTTKRKRKKRKTTKTSSRKRKKSSSSG